MDELTFNDFAKSRQWINQADTILITASNGLSIAEGYHIFADNDDYQKYFGKFRQKYGTDCLIRGVFTPMTTADHQEYMQMVHQYLIDDYQGSQVMHNLQQIINDKPSFIITSNADTHFQINGFDPKAIFEVEGNFDGLTEQSQPWKEQQQRFAKFMNDYADKQVVLLELGIGSHNQLIKAPTMQLAQAKDWQFITMNMPREINVPQELVHNAIALTGDIGENFQKLLNA